MARISRISATFAYPAYPTFTPVMIVLVSFGLVAGACKSEGIAKSGSDKSGDNTEDPVPVEVTTLITGTIEGTLRFSANLEAESQVEVMARTTGLVRRVLVEEGDKVAANQILLRIEDGEQQSQFSRTKLDLAKAEIELQKQEKLHARGVTSDQALELARYDRDRLKLLLADAGRSLRYTVVRSPIAGTVTQRIAVQGSQVLPQQPLFAITDFATLVARVYVPEKHMQALAVGQHARLFATSSGDIEHRGIVERIAPQIDPRSGTIKVTISVPEEAGLAPGMFVDVELVIETHPNAVLLPKRAVVYDNDIPYAFVVTGDNRAHRVRVTTLLENRDFIESVEGFAAGDQVVIAGQIGLKQEALVEVKNETGTASGTMDKVN